MEGRGGEGEGERRGEEGGGKEEERGGEALAVEPSHFSTGSDATASRISVSDSDLHFCSPLRDTDMRLWYWQFSVGLNQGVK